jgi:hypothetical protein
MTLDARKRQKKRANRVAKRKAALASKKQAGLVGSARQIVSAVSGPVHECLIPESLFDLGIGNVIVSRTLPTGQIGAAFFLVDVFCLGIKDAFFEVMSLDDYDYRLSGLQQEKLKRTDPACARKLVEGAEAYARDLGFKPSPGYQVAKRIFGDIEATTCSVHFEFGQDGKPHFMSGPYDTPAKCRRIFDTLSKRCGPGGFHFTLVTGDPFDDFDDDDDDDVIDVVAEPDKTQETDIWRRLLGKSDS